MEVFKVGLVIAVGLGSTWAARATTDALFGPPLQLMQAQEPEPAPVSQPDAARGAPPAVPEMSREEMDAELRRAQAEIAGQPAPGEIGEFRPSKPLPADLPIAMPSDI